MLVSGNLNVVVALKLKGLVLNTFCTSIFLGHYPNLCSTLKQIIQGQWIGIFLDLTNWVLVHAISFIDLTIMVGIIGTYFFLSWQVSIEWPILTHSQVPS